MTPAVPLSAIAAENRFDSIISRAAERHGVPPAIIKAVIATESSFNPNAVRDEPALGDRSRGLMQLLEGTARGLGIPNPAVALMDPVVNIFAGAQLLAQLYARLKSWPDTLAAYNGGRPRKDSTGKLVPQLQAYVDKVQENLKRFSPVATGLGLGLVVLLALLVASKGGRT